MCGTTSPKDSILGWIDTEELIRTNQPTRQIGPLSEQRGVSGSSRRGYSVQCEEVGMGHDPKDSRQCGSSGHAGSPLADTERPAREPLAGRGEAARLVRGPWRVVPHRVM